jgi:alpha-N-acetylglucosamine transferase
MSIANTTRAFITLVSDDQSTIGAIIMNEALRFLNSEYPLLAMITEQESHLVIEKSHFMQVSSPIRHKLECLGMVLVEVDTVPVPAHVHPQHQRWLPTFTKLQMWNLHKFGFEKLVYIDGDSIIMQNVDALFDMKELAAAQDFVGKVAHLSFSTHAVRTSNTTNFVEGCSF